MTADQSAQRIYELLTQALSADAPRRQQAEQLLREAEEHQDFFASLADIATASDEQAAPNVRFLAAAIGKNAVSRSWRRRVRHNDVTEDERTYVRGVLLSGLGQRNATVATQISVWISLVARVDYPRDWPNLMDVLADAIRGNDAGVVMHALITLDMVLKQLASRRLLADRQALYRVAPKLFSLLHDTFCAHLQVLVRGQESGEAMRKSFDVVVRCMKSFRRILAYGCQTLSGIPLVSELLGKIVQQPDVFMRGAKGGSDEQARLSLLAAKLVRSTHERHPVEFQPFLPTFLNLYYQTVISFNSDTSSDRTCFQAAYFLRNVAQCPLYNISGTTIQEFRKAAIANTSAPVEISADACRFIVLAFFDDARTSNLIEAMITRIFVLSKRELETWSSDPEMLVREEDAAEWGTENLRYQCEELFKLLLVRDKPRVVPMILKLAESVPPEKPLLRDACYRAVGRAVYDVQGAFDFDMWLTGQLGAILQANCSEHLGERIIQARTAWLVAQFTEQLTRESRQVVNPLLVRLMTFMDQDRVIALTAAKAVQTLVEDLGFHAGDFAPHLEPFLISCFRLIHTSETFETKRDILGAVSSLVERCAACYIVPVLDLIASSLPMLWEETGIVTAPERNVPVDYEEGKGKALSHEVSSGGESLLRTGIVGLLTALVRKTGPASLQSLSVRNIVFPVIGFAVDPTKGKGGAYMMEEGCALWAAVVAASTEYTEELRVLFPQTERILGVDFDNLRDVFSIMESYALLGREQFMQEYGQMLNATLSRALGAVKDRGNLAAAEILDILLQLFPQDGVRFTKELLSKLCTKVLAKDESPVVTSAFLGVLARASLVNIVDTENLVLQSNEETCVSLLDALIDNVDAMYRLPRRKLAVLALCGLTTRYSTSVHVLSKMPSVLNAVVQVLSEENKLRVKKEGPPPKDDFQELLARFGEEAGEDMINRGNARDPLPEEARRQLLKERDVVEQTDLRDVCAHLLTSAKAAGHEQYEAALRATDGTVLQQLEQLVQK